ncbi:site-specific integrase [Devosia faecipullorum]|uniref:site-specific integrase n=1 Tax=Devosia faecipullorum TaxID=2755039 RepID=UPI00187B8F1B|nr:site-specific integrase [Devosia faecipullorum]MBE7734486.1 site-specific integrase [Devosia faecipullorum]
MTDVPKHLRLVQRNGVFYHRASIPADIRDTYPKTEETFSLKTKDPREAIKRVRVAAAEVDARFDEHRRRQNAVLTTRDELTAAELKAVEEAYYAYLLEEDDQRRDAGFYAGEELELPAPTFEEYDEQVVEALTYVQHQLPRRASDVFYDQEVDEVMSWDGFDIKLAPNAASRKKVVAAIQRGEVRAYKDIALRNKGELVDTPEAPAVIAPKSCGVLLSDAVQDWLKDKRSGWTDKTAKAHEVAIGWFCDLVGDRSLSSYSKADGRAFKAAMQTLPANWVKHPKLAKLSIGKAVERSAELCLTPMSGTNASKNIQFVQSFWNWAEANYDEVDGNPMVKLSKPKGVARDERDPFTDEDLKTIFLAPLYRGCRSLHHWKEPGNFVPIDSGRYWVPLVALHTGARLAEIVQLYVEDVKFEGEIAYLSLMPGDDEEDDRRVKNANARRNIPIHSQLVSAGFLEFVQRAKTANQKRLFPDIEKAADGTYSSTFSKWFGNFLKACGVKTKKKSFHSFRHTFEDACRAGGVPLEYVNAIQGHAQGGEADRYGSGAGGYPISLLKERIEQVRPCACILRLA